LEEIATQDTCGVPELPIVNEPFVFSTTQTIGIPVGVPNGVNMTTKFVSGKRVEFNVMIGDASVIAYVPVWMGGPFKFNIGTQDMLF